MNTNLIPEEDWISFFSSFSREHAGCPTSVEVLDSTAGPQLVAADLPLIGISFEIDGSRSRAVEIAVGDAEGHYITHAIETPLHIHVADAPHNRVELRFEPASGPITLVHLHKPAPQIISPIAI